MTRLYLVLSGLLVATAIAAVLTGPGDLSNDRLFGVFLELRTARLVAAFLAGAALAVGGVIVQGLFQNPLADPSIIGTTAGANLGGRVVLFAYEGLFGGTALGWIAPEMLIPVGCVIGAFFALGLILLVHRVGDDLIVLLLTGFLLSSLFASFGGLVISLIQERFELARAMLSFALGDVSGVGTARILVALPLVASGVAAALFWARPLDLLLSGEADATALGVDVSVVRTACVIWTAMLTAGAVSIAGAVGFVGLIVPHALRPFVGAGHGRLIPASALLGGTFVAACDVLTRALPGRSEMPLGVVTGLIGAPLFLFLLIRSRRELAHG